MSVSFEKHKPGLLAAWKDVVDDKTATDWVLLGYEGLSNDLKVVSKGDQGIEEMKEELNSGKVMYAFCRVLDPKTTLHKFILINWQGEGAPLNRKGSCAGHLRDIANFFKGAHVTINVRNEEEIDEDIIIEKLSKSSGSSYSFKARSEQTAPVKEPVGTTYKKVIPKQEINSAERDKFWAAEEEAERRRQAEETRVREERQKRAELERQQRELSEAASREEKSKEIENNIKNESVLIEKVTNHNIVKSRIFEKTNNIMIEKEEEAKKTRNEEAKEIIGTRTVNARAIFEQNAAAVKNSHSTVSSNKPGEFGVSANSRPSDPQISAANSKSSIQQITAANLQPADPQIPAANSQPSEPQTTPVTIRTSNSQIHAINSQPSDPQMPADNKQPSDSLIPTAISQPSDSQIPVAHAQPSDSPVLVPDSRPSDSQIPAANLRPSNSQFPPSNLRSAGSQIPSSNQDIENATKVVSPESASLNGSSESPALKTKDELSKATDNLSRVTDDLSKVNDNLSSLNSSETTVTNVSPIAKTAESIEVESITEESISSKISSESDSVKDQNNLDSVNLNDSNYNDRTQNGEGLRAVALYDYQAADETEISFDPGQVITHIDQIDVGWWQGLGPDGTYGLFPANYVELLD